MRQGRTDAWIAHQLDVSVRDIGQFKREHELAPAEATEGEAPGPVIEEEPDLRAEDDALVAAALEAEQEEDQPASEEDDAAGGRQRSRREDDDDRPKRRRRGRRGGRGRGRGAGGRKPLEGTFDHGEEGYGLWLDPAVQDDPVYAEHWAGHRPVTVAVEADRIVITRTGEEPSGRLAPKTTTSYALDNALYQWEEGERRLRETNGHPARRRNSSAPGGRSTGELRRRLGAAFLLAEPGALYGEDLGLGRGRRAPGARRSPT